MTRTRWLAVKLGLVGLASVIAAALGTLAVDWWSDPLDKTAATDFARMEPLLFPARGVVPIGYAAFAFALGVTVGMLVRRTVSAMAVTLAIFVLVQITMPLLVRQHLIPPVRSTAEVGATSLDGIRLPPDGGPLQAHLGAPEGGAFTGAWVLSSHAVDGSGNAVETIPLSRTGPCAPPSPREISRAREPGLSPACLAEIRQSGYRQHVTYQPAGRFWTFQAIETAIFVALALLLSGFCFWWLRNRLS